MQLRPRYRLMRRILYPYNGEQPLSLKQSLRVLLAWVLFFPLTMALLALVLSIILFYPVQKIVLFVVISFLTGVFVFGLFALLIVMMGNKAARLHQTWKIQKEQQ
jgi:lipopolysaccharide export LptBFGC system permease protein LptF